MLAVTCGAPATTVLPIDWDNDFKTDLLVAGRRGVRLFLQSDSNGFVDSTSHAGADAGNCDCPFAWAADVEMDGDVDVILGASAGPTRVLRNNGDGTWQALP